MPRFNRLLITGAAGNLGQELRRGLAPLATTIRLTDRATSAQPRRMKKPCPVNSATLTR